MRTVEHLSDRLHLGCGLTAPEGWLNVDGSWSAWLAKHPHMSKLLRATHVAPRRLFDAPWPTSIFVYNVRKPLPFPEGSFRAVYSSHLLEHVHLSEAKKLLQECYRVLAPGGVARFVVPDLKAHVEEYLGGRKVRNPNEEFEVLTAADRFNRNMMMRPHQPRNGSVLYRMYAAATDFHSHKWMYDAESLAFHMGAAGFVEVSERAVHESRIEGIEAIENPDRIAGGHGVCVEGVKPQT